MRRKFIDCREYPSEMNCTVAFSADSDEELLEVAVQHAVQVHHHKDSPELASANQEFVQGGHTALHRIEPCHVPGRADAMKGGGVHGVACFRLASRSLICSVTINSLVFSLMLVIQPEK